ncbi:3-hydroxyacyl-CoA dehydrogenase NAD-binding domain-containing protein [Actinotalea sp.]|uniref:3-hydroxyacyl-CoA dehydrogenase NAD-binding domain-containing protein n=1 Tax=Actinotalea sp. TaxID=1872145 RepID=UPI0035622BF3
MTTTKGTTPTEHVTHALVRDVHLATGDVLALVTLDNGEDRPTTLGPAGLTELREVLLAQRERATAGRIAAVAVTGKPGYLAAGADLRGMATLTRREQGLELARLGHDTYRLLGELGVPTFCFINGAALGGGLEIALHCTYRTVASDVRALALPETMLGLVPGWGGATLLPRIIGARAALAMIVEAPLGGNRMTDAATAVRTGLADVALHPADFLEQSVVWAGQVLAGEVSVERRPLDDEQTWSDAVATVRAQVDHRFGTDTPAPLRALDLVAAARTADLDTAYAAEDDALGDLLVSDQLRAGLYAFDLTNRRARTPAGAPDPSLALPVRAVGIVGAGLMAVQLALLVARRLRVPVVMRELDEEKAAAGRETVRSTVASLAAKGRVTDAEANRLLSSISVGTELSTFAPTDLVIEAVTEILEVKKRVFAELEAIVRPDTVLATNTSALSVTRMAQGLRHPERVVGLHFFNPVAQMPLVEVVRTAGSSDAAVATAFAVAAACGKSAVGVADRPGFVVNRLLLRQLAEVAAAVERGTPVEVADAALRPLGLPMRPFALMQLVGLPVTLHVLGTLHEAFGERFPLSPGLEQLSAAGRRVVPEPDGTGREREVDPAIQDAFGAPAREGALDAQGVLDAVLAGLTQEVGLLLEEGVVSAPQDVDLCMILGAGFPFHLGGLVPLLDRTGWTTRVLGHRLLPAGVASIG